MILAEAEAIVRATLSSLWLLSWILHEWRVRGGERAWQNAKWRAKVKARLKARARRRAEVLSYSALFAALPSPFAACAEECWQG